MKAYPQYKDSGVPWLGNVPEHWESLKLRTILSPNTKRNRPDLPLLSVVREKGVVKRNTKSKEENHNTIPEDLSNYKVVRSGQLAMNKMKAWQGSYGVSAFDGIVSPAYFIFDINRVGGEFFHLAMRSKSYIPFFTRASDGVRVGQWDLNQTRMKEIPFFVPPLDEQQQISRYLHWQSSKISKFIKAKKRLISLLKEQKQNIINEAVTKGINPDVKMKDSGVEWLGEIPEHWEVSKNKGVYSERRESGSDELPILSVSIHHGVSTKEQNEKENLRAKVRIQDRKKYLRVYPNDIAFNMMRAWQGGIGVVRVNGMVSPAYIVGKPKREVNSGFVEFLFRTPLFVQEMDRNSRGITDFRKRLYWDQYKNISIVLPPVDEQRLIVDHIEKETSNVNNAISRAEKEIELIQEYHTRLVSDVVTGKVDIRAIKIPDFEPVEADVEISDDEEIEDELISEAIEE